MPTGLLSAVRASEKQLRTWNQQTDKPHMCIYSPCPAPAIVEDSWLVRNLRAQLMWNGPCSLPMLVTTSSMCGRCKTDNLPTPSLVPHVAWHRLSILVGVCDTPLSPNQQAVQM